MLLLVGRPGLDPGTLGLNGTFQLLFCVSLVAHVHCYQGIVLFCVGLVSWRCRNMRPKMRPIRAYQFAFIPMSFKIGSLRLACGFASGQRHQQSEINFIARAIANSEKRQP